MQAVEGAAVAEPERREPAEVDGEDRDQQQRS